uniref:Mitochondrial aspartate/glutamate carrier protein Aralar/Citrin n=1 Tax=Clandestinovirus TaxID=2831644 RepID=A0A8F8KP94_9VIRU|nr:mitochondrial aspartate/glutamate carrier protein Aralar/Citrin [Clandestinovirus]
MNNKTRTTNLVNLLHSAIATTIAEFATLPICTVKTNYQNTSGITIGGTIRKIYKQDGIVGFYRASLPTIGSQVVSTSSKFMLYRMLEDLNLPYTNKITNGIMAGITSSLVTHPMDYVKVHWQMNKPVRKEIAEQGPRVLYRGYSKTVSKVVLSSSLFFPLYDTFATWLKGMNVEHWASISAFGSSFVSTLIMHPIDYLKTRHIYAQPLYQGFNPKIYYKGVTLNLARVVPHFTMVMTIVELLNKRSRT